LRWAERSTDRDTNDGGLMGLRVVQDLVVPKYSGKTIPVRRGQLFRAIASEGKQVLDVT
jgi:uncharacterized protein YcgI (DUF1989 family)